LYSDKNKEFSRIATVVDTLLVYTKRETVASRCHGSGAGVVMQASQRCHGSGREQASRHMGISSPRDKIVQKALHAVLEAIFEPKFLNSSHGFRPQKSVHSALLRVYQTGHRYN
jgi:hypothetical protein